MTERLGRLLDAVWEHDQPLGPFGDLDVRMQAEWEWMGTLTVDDCLALLDWVEHAQLPPRWEPFRRRWLPSLIDRAMWYASGVRDLRVTHRFLQLFAQPDLRSAALEGLVELADPAAYDTLLCCLGDRVHRSNLCVALSAWATLEQMGHLRHLTRSAPTAELREAATEIVEQWKTNRPEPGFALDIEPNGNGGGSLPEGAPLSLWRTDTVVLLARQMDTSRDYSSMPILADALQDAGCDNEAVLHHCRNPGPHVCGCWVVDCVLGRK